MAYSNQKLALNMNMQQADLALNFRPFVVKYNRNASIKSSLQVHLE